ncbi:MAG: O-antigen ligase family protein [Chromatiales bacterium]|nr:O-antigen ligase family protein [Chromatiales bacterium]
MSFPFFPRALIAEPRFFALLALLAWAPVPLGSNRTWAWALLACGVFLLLALFFLRHGAVPPPVAARWPLTLLLIWLAWLACYLLPLPLGVIDLVSPATAMVYRYALGSSPSSWHTLSLDPGASLDAWLRSACYVGIFYLLVVQLNRRERRRGLAVALVAVGGLEAVLGLADFFTGNIHTFVPKPAWRVDLSGSFVNRNHFAGFMELALPMTVALLFAKSEFGRDHSGWKAAIRTLSRFLLGTGALWVGLLLIMATALILSGSRGGVFALVLAFALGFFLLIMRGGEHRELRWLPVLLAVAVGALLWTGSGPLGKKLSEIGLENNRDLIRQVSWNIVKDYPLIGTGPGSFRSVFPLYKDRELGARFYDHAHNDYLEVWVEQGIVGLGLLTAAVGSLLLAMVRGLRHRRDPLYRSLLFGSLVACLSLSAHALVDFNWQIPANAAWFFALLALGVSCAQGREAD